MSQVSYGTITITDTTDIESIKNWYLATNASSGVTKNTTGWTDTIQQITSNKQYLWNYEQILGTNNIEISSTQPVIIGHFGINGTNGTNGTNGVDGNSIVSIDEYYQATNSTSNPGSSGWQKNTLVTPTSINKYLWNYQVINYSKTSSEGSYNDARIIGVYGDTGQRGTSILKVTTAPSTASGTIGGFTYSYRMSLSTVKSQSGKSEVLVGDIVEYNSNHYQVGYIDSTYVYLSAATSIKGADGQTYYTWIKYAPNDNPTNAQISDSPTNMTYIGIYTGTITPAPSTASSYAPWMKYKGVSVTGTRELYYLKTNSTNPSQITNSNQITTTDRQNGWTSIVPTYVANGTYYTCIETSLSAGGPVWSTPIENKGLTNANAKALDAYNTSTARDTEINAIKAQAKHYWWDTQGAHVAAGENTTNVDNITQGTASTYGFNSLMAPGYLALKYKDINFAQLATNSLTFYRPATNGSTYVQGKKGMDLTADALTFYKPLAYNSSSEPTIAAQLTSNGLKISDGIIQLGTNDSSSTSSGCITLSNVDFTRSINGTSRSNLRLAIGQYFGIKNDGSLYASNAIISGAITATSLSLGSGVQISASTDISGLSTVATSGSYNDLNNKPTIPSLTGYIYQNGTVGTTPADGATGFVVSSSGLLTASNAVIYGSIYASKGYIGGWQIGTDGNKTLHNGNANTSPVPGSGVIILSKGITGPTTATGVLPANQTWAITASNQFGVTTAGKLYASEADIQGSITATSLTINGNDYITQIPEIQNKASNGAEYTVTIAASNWTTTTCTLTATVYKLGTAQTTSTQLQGISYKWYKDGNIISGQTTTTLSVTDLNAVYTCVISK